MTRDSAPDPGRRARRHLALLVVGGLVVLAAIALLAVHLVSEVQAGSKPVARQPVGSKPVARQPVDRDARVVWRDVAGVLLPFSPIDGPRVTDHGHAGGYSHTRQGAALAAVQVLTRTSATAGPAVYRPVLADQVIDSNVTALAETLDAQYEAQRQLPGQTVPDGQPLPGNDATVAGYLVTAYNQADGAALIDVLLGAPELAPGQVVDFQVGLEWSGGDWRVLAPPDGDWGVSARLLDAVPAGALDYREA